MSVWEKLSLRQLLLQNPPFFRKQVLSQPHMNLLIPLPELQRVIRSFKQHRKIFLSS